jgi:hypothetical protein
MSQTKKAAAPKSSKAKAARAEKAPEPKSFEWRGLTLTLPKTLPGTLLFDLASLESGNLGATIAVLHSLLGAEQVATVRQKVAEDEIPFEDVFEEVDALLHGVIDVYGVAPGESSASQVS